MQKINAKSAISIVGIMGALLVSSPLIAAETASTNNESPYITKLRASAEQGDVEAQSNLGDAYLVGSGVPKNTTEAAKWWRKAGDQGNAKAQANLGALYYQGTGVPKDSTEAVKWWRKAAELNNANAEDQLGFAYLLGDGVVKNYTQAYLWFNLAAAQGDAHAVKDRDNVAKYLTAAQMADAQRQAGEWMQKHPAK